MRRALSTSTDAPSNALSFDFGLTAKPAEAHLAELAESIIADLMGADDTLSEGNTHILYDAANNNILVVYTTGGDPAVARDALATVVSYELDGLTLTLAGVSTTSVATADNSQAKLILPFCEARAHGKGGKDKKGQRVGGADAANKEPGSDNRASGSGLEAVLEGKEIAADDKDAGHATEHKHEHEHGEKSKDTANRARRHGKKGEKTEESGSEVPTVELTQEVYPAGTDIGDIRKNIGAIGDIGDLVGWVETGTKAAAGSQVVVVEETEESTKSPKKKKGEKSSKSPKSPKGETTEESGSDGDETLKKELGNLQNKYDELVEEKDGSQVVVVEETEESTKSPKKKKGEKSSKSPKSPKDAPSYGRQTQRKPGQDSDNREMVGECIQRVSSGAVHAERTQQIAASSGFAAAALVAAAFGVVVYSRRRTTADSVSEHSPLMGDQALTSVV